MMINGISFLELYPHALCQPHTYTILRSLTLPLINVFDFNHSILVNNNRYSFSFISLLKEGETQIFQYLIVDSIFSKKKYIHSLKVLNFTLSRSSTVPFSIKLITLDIYNYNPIEEEIIFFSNHISQNRPRRKK